MKFMMTDGKTAEAVETPTYVMAAGPTNQEKKGVQKKYVIAGVSAVLIVGLIITGVLVAVHISSEAQKEIIRYSLQFKGSNGEDVKQDVESDPNDNVVMYTLSKPGQDSIVVNDFNKGMQIVKMTNSKGVNCYVSALNRTNAMDPSKITGPESQQDNKGESAQQTYLVSNEPVTDRTFLTKKALDMCKGVSLYWIYRDCGEKMAGNATDVGTRNRRTLYFVGYYNGLPGLGGCCRSVYACRVEANEYYSGGYHYCNFYAYSGICCSSTPYCNYIYYGDGPC